MYSYEDRIRAVKLHIKLGRRVKATIQPTVTWPPASSLSKNA